MKSIVTRVFVPFGVKKIKNNLNLGDIKLNFQRYTYVCEDDNYGQLANYMYV